MTGGLELVQELKAEGKLDKTGSVTEVNLLKKLHKTEKKSDKDSVKKEHAILTAKIKDLQASRRVGTKDFEKLKKAHDILLDTYLKETAV
jgi:hypothetical protein